MEIRLALLARPGTSHDRYLAALQGRAQVDSAATMTEFLELLRRQAYHGLLLDIPTQIKSPGKERDELAVILARFPTARLNWRPETELISVLVLGASTSGDYTLNDFIENQCRHFRSAPVRSENRIDINLNLLLFRQPSDDPALAERTVTLDISWGGCFILTGQDWPLGTRAWMVLKELPGWRPIQLEVRWAQPWGLARRLPGIGCQFLDLSLEQAQEIVRLLGLG
ncbi:MAG: PilZ domain-containing protein [Pseudomonadota bacterium]